MYQLLLKADLHTIDPCTNSGEPNGVGFLVHVMNNSICTTGHNAPNLLCINNTIITVLAKYNKLSKRIYNTYENFSYWMDDLVENPKIHTMLHSCCTAQFQKRIRGY